MKLSEAFQLYRLNIIIFSNQSKKTEEHHNIALSVLLSYFGDIDIEELTFPMVREWKMHLDVKRSPSTVRGYIIRLRVVLAHLKSLGLAVLDPNLIPVPKRADKVPSFITKEEVTRMIEAVSRPVPGYPLVNRMRNRAIISFLYASGLRVSELCALDILDLNYDSFTVVGKGGKARLAYIDHRTRAYLDIYLEVRKDNNPALFISELNKRRITPAGVQEVFKLAKVKAGIQKPVTPHVMRHSFSTDFLRNNGNMRYLQVLLGHSSLQTTQMYTTVVDTDLRKAYDAHHSI